MNGRVGLLGGTFDPPHSAHLVMAQTAREALGLEKIFLLPSPRPPHKGAGALSDYEDRVEMARIAARVVDALEVSDLEADRTGPSYTVDTLRLCRDRFGFYPRKGKAWFIDGKKRSRVDIDFSN